MNLRKSGFLILDSLKGGKVKKHLREIEELIHTKNTNDFQLEKILNYALKNVPSYQMIKNARLSDFPVVTKKEYMDNFDMYQSEIANKKKLHWISTSGSTGQPFKANQDEIKRNRTIADLIYFQQKFNWELGEKYVYMRAWTSKYNTAGVKEKLQNYIPIDIVNFDQKSKENLRSILKKDFKIKSLIGYGSALESFATYIEEKEDNKEMFNLKIIFSVSDNLSQNAKTKLEKIFGCPVINRYSNEELGLLAYTKPYSDEFILNTQSFYFELLNLSNNEPVGPGELGRIVITDLYNHSMPFIRYDTGDLATSNDIDRARLKTLSSFQGRVSDIIYAENGSAITAVILNNYFADIYSVKKYQLIQLENSTYELKVEIVDDYDATKLVGICTDLLGKTAVIEITVMDNIPVEKNGKYKTIINKLKI